MSTAAYTEDSIAQQTTADYLRDKLGWKSAYAYNNEDLGQDSLLGRNSEREVVLTRPLHDRLAALNPGLPGATYDDAVRQLTAAIAAQALVATNREKYSLMRTGVQVTCKKNDGKRLRVFDMEDTLYDVPAQRRFSGIDLENERAPDQTTICKFRHLLEKHNLGEKLFCVVNQYPVENSLRISPGTIVDASIIRQSETSEERTTRRRGRRRRATNGTLG